MASTPKMRRREHVCATASPVGEEAWVTTTPAPAGPDVTSEVTAAGVPAAPGARDTVPPGEGRTPPPADRQSLSFETDARRRPETGE